MNIVQFMQLAEDHPGIKKVMMATEWQANYDITNIVPEDFPVLVFNPEIPERFETRSDGFIDSFYLPEMQLIFPCKFDENYIVKYGYQENLRTIYRQLIYRANNHKSMKDTGRYIAVGNILGMIDTQYDDNLIGCQLNIELPHVDPLQSC